MTSTKSVFKQTFISSWKEAYDLFMIQNETGKLPAKTKQNVAFFKQPAKTCHFSANDLAVEKRIICLSHPPNFLAEYHKDFNIAFPA